MGIFDIFKKKGKDKPYQQPEPRLKSPKTAPAAAVAKPATAKTEASVSPLPVKKAAAKEVAKKPKETKKGAAAKGTKQERRKDGGNAYKVLVRQIVTEKSARLQEKHNQYTFEVVAGANKVEIRKAVQALYGVNVEKVAILKKAGKYARFGQYYGQQKTRKKAIVTLREGDKITL